MALLCLLLVISNHLLLISAPASRGPDNCRCTTHEKRVICRCPYRIRGGSSCSWIGYGGKYSFPECLDTIPTDFDKATVSIFIKHLRSPVILKGSFPNSPDVWMLQIRESNVSRVQPGAFRGLPLVSNLYLDDNRISSLEPDTFLGLEKVTDLNLRRNAISVISQHAFRGLSVLKWLTLSMNRLRSVPVVALLPLTALKIAHFRKNHITTIDSQILRLNHNQTVRLLLADNQLKCDANLTWFICNLPDMDYISGPEFLKCVSPANLNGTLLATVRKDISQTNTDRSPHVQGIRLGRCDVTSTTTGPHTHHTSLYNHTSLHNHTSLYNHTIPTEMTYTNTRPGSESTTGTDVFTLHGGPIINEEDNSYHVNTVIMAVAVPLLMVLASGVVAYLYERCRGTGPPVETDGSQKIEPYAVTYSNSAGLRASGTQTSPSQDQTTEGNNDIEPYAVSYMDVSGKGKNGKLAPYATTSFANIQTAEDSDNIQPIEDNDDIEPYAVSYMDVSGKGKIGKLFPYATTSFANIQTAEDSDNIQPYAVSYVDVSGKGQNGKLFPYATTSIDEDPGPQLQPYSVTHDEDPGPQLQPYAVTHDEDPGPQLQPYAMTHDEDLGPQLQPYAVTRDEDPGLQLQPYAVTYNEDRGQNGKLFPYATTSINEDPGPQLQPYAVTHDEDPGPQLQSYAVTRDEDRVPFSKPRSQSLPRVHTMAAWLKDSLRVWTAHLPNYKAQLTLSVKVQTLRTAHLTNCTAQLTVSVKVRTAHLTNCTAQLTVTLKIRTALLTNYTAHGQCESLDSTSHKLYSTAQAQLTVSVKVCTGHLTNCTAHLKVKVKVLTAHLTNWTAYLTSFAGHLQDSLREKLVDSRWTVDLLTSN
ncbi:PREDICTED: uncharacterized protein LOC109479450 [Branchiostoma belcheri]|uniref:Uncharacterized protein LOC109479450 n=1 Tax=Branchiostoma belcheri TaxID=7741 RepID=A0A6P4ZSA6_BRABE|nr:PREDICTED: uncharacterized protein LOC109479450 [Branchiostoma belcheri]